MTRKITLHWFRQDLRLSDNPSLSFAAEQGLILPIYIFDTVHSADLLMGRASQLWLRNSLKELSESLQNQLVVLTGDPITLIVQLCQQYEIDTVVWNRCYEPWRINRDKTIKETLLSLNIDVKSFNGSLLWEPWTISKKDGTPYKVFTPFYRKGCLQSQSPRLALPEPNEIQLLKTDQSKEIPGFELDLSQKWIAPLEEHVQAGEKAAHDKLEQFIDQHLYHYKQARDFPSINGVSRLSPHLHFGEISPNQVWYTVQQCADDQNVDHFCSELGWREFSYSQLYFNPNLPQENLQSKFDRFPWNKNKKHLKAWQNGRTGIPMVDAGMRELYQTGTMHNRVRMITGSFLVKNLLLDWREGEKWFWDCLFDADLASNSASWQWVAGCGADAAPYFRIFNPVTQAKRFDPEGIYIRTYLPELTPLPNKYIHAPWEAPEDILSAAGVTLGVHYPNPLVDLKLSRQKALDAFASLKKGTDA